MKSPDATFVDGRHYHQYTSSSDINTTMITTKSNLDVIDETMESYNNLHSPLPQRNEVTSPQIREQSGASYNISSSSPYSREENENTFHDYTSSPSKEPVNNSSSPIREQTRDIINLNTPQVINLQTPQASRKSRALLRFQEATRMMEQETRLFKEESELAEQELIMKNNFISPAPHSLLRTAPYTNPINLPGFEHKFLTGNQKEMNETTTRIDTSPSVLKMSDITQNYKLIDSQAEKLKLKLGKFLYTSPLDISKFKVGRGNSSDILSFLLIVNNFLGQLLNLEHLYILIVLKAIEGTSFLDYFMSRNTLPISNDNGWGQKYFTAIDIAAWTFDAFCKEIFVVFVDPNYKNNIFQMMSSWNEDSFPNMFEAMTVFKTTGSHLALFQKYTDCPKKYCIILEENKHYLWRIMKLNFINEFNLFCAISTKKGALQACAELSFAEMEQTLLAYQRDLGALSDHKFNLNQNLKQTPTPITFKSKDRTVAAVTSIVESKEDLLCEECGKKGHTVEKCWVAHPELIRNWNCRNCRGKGHFPQDCPLKKQH